MIVRVVAAACLCTVGASLAAAQDRPFTLSHGDVSVIGGHDAVDSGFDDRTYASGFANVYTESGLGAHAEIAGVTREEDAVFFAGGLSYNTQPFSIKGVLGTSTDNRSILANSYARIESTFRTDPAFGLTVTPSVTYRHFRNDVEEINAGLNFTKYFDLTNDRQFIAQVFGAAVVADPGDNLGGYGAVDLTYGEYKGWSFGSTFEIGRSSFTSLIAASSVQSDFFSVRPHAGFYVTDDIEVFGQVSYYNTEDFDLIGGAIGVKYSFGGTPRF